MTYIEGLEDLRGKELLIRSFEFVQRIPYRVSRFESNPGVCREATHIGLEKGDCRHKTLLLYNLLMERNFDVERVKVVFDWRDLPIPAEILGILKSGTRWSHDALKFRVNDKYSIYIDPTWNVELERLGFPVTRSWDGDSNTAQVTRGKLEYFDHERFNGAEHGVVVDKEEALEFGRALNEWLDRECGIR